MINYLTRNTKNTKKKDEKFKNIKEKWDDIKVYLRNNKTLLYLMPTTFFIVAMVGTFVHGIIVNNSIGFEIVEINEPQPFGIYEVTVTAISFNPDEAIHRMDVFFDTTTHNVDLFEFNLKVNAVALIDPSQLLDIEIVRVTSQFFVIYIRDLPVSFGAIRKDITYFADENHSLTISIRTEEAQSVIDYNLEIEIDRLQLMSYALVNDIRILEIQVAEYEYQISELEEEKATNLNHIQQLESDMIFQISDQLAASQSRVEAFINQNTNIEGDIKELENIIEETLNQIELIKQTINEL